MGRNRLAREIEKCITKGCGCELVQCTVTSENDADDSSNEAGYSHSTLSGYYTIIGKFLRRSCILCTFRVYYHGNPKFACQ